MASVRLSDAADMARQASRPRTDLEYCRQVGAYLGLSVETVISTMLARGIAARSPSMRPRRVGPGGPPA